MTIPPDLEPQVRRILHSLAPAETISTAELAGRIAGNGAAAKAARAATMSHLLKLAENTGGLATRGEPIQRYGKTMRPWLWRHIESPAMPQRAQTQSFGAATPGTSLADRVQRLEEYLAARDPLFTFL